MGLESSGRVAALIAELFGLPSYGFEAAATSALSGKLTKCLCLFCLCLCIFSASDNIPKADTIRTLIKDLWDTRMAKLRVSADSFVRQQEAHAKVRMALLSPPWASGHCQSV